MTKKRTWQESFDALVDYKVKNGHCCVPQKDMVLGKWVSTQRKTRAKLSAKQFAALNEIGFVWDAQSEKWNELYGRLRTYRETHNDCNVPRRWKEDVELAAWVTTQRTHQRYGIMSAERKEKLDTMGFTWSQQRRNNSRWQ